MKLSLFNFRKYKEIEFEIGDRITKISGESGTGKSTIFAAIAWCLYGKIRDVKPRGENVTPQVVFELTCIIDEKPQTVRIYRSSSKNVVLNIGDVQYDGDVAQAKINDLFGTNESFPMTSFLAAETMHPLICATPSEKRELTSLLFPDAAKHDHYKEKLLIIRRKDESTLATLRVNVAATSSAISTLEASNSWLLTEVPTAGDSPGTDLAGKLRTLMREKDEAQRTSTMYTTVSSQLASLPDPIDTSDMRSELETIQGRLLQVSVQNMSKDANIAYIQERIDSVVKKINQIRTDSGYGDIDVFECRRIISICEQLLCMAPSEASLEEQIDKLRAQHREASQKLIEYENSLRAIEHNRKLEDILECPSCHTKLRHTHSLVMETETITRQEVQHQVTQSAVEKERVFVDRLHDKSTSLMKDLQKYHEMVTKEKAKYPSFSDADLQGRKNSLNEYIQLRTQLSGLEADLERLKADTREYITKEEHEQLSSSKRRLEKEISNAQAIESQRSSLKAQLEKISANASWLDNAQEHIASLDEQIAGVREDIQSEKQRKDKIRIYEMYIKHKENLEKYNVQTASFEKRVDASHKLESILASTYSDYVGRKLREIEYDVCILGKTFFDETMNISLTPGKESSTGIIRPSFDLRIEYGGTHYEDIKTMSTGERKRLSLILMIVLTKYMDGKFMLLDEALSSLSIDLRAIILNEVRRIGIPVLLSSHDALPGGYDDELDLNRL